MRKFTLTNLVLFLLLALAAPAFAHNIVSNIEPSFPWMDGSTWGFKSTHTITYCWNGGDAGTCGGNPVGFRAHAKAQVKVGSVWSDIGDPVVSETFNYPSVRIVSITKRLYCGPSDVGKTFTFRTMAKGSIKHMGTWYYTDWFPSSGRTDTCTRAAGADKNLDDSLEEIAEVATQPALEVLALLPSHDTTEVTDNLPDIWTIIAPAG